MSSASELGGRFAGRTAVVTGAGSGIGRATALRLAREEARVVAADIATEEGAQAVVAAAGGRVDALANVAGIMDAFLPPAEVDDANIEAPFESEHAAGVLGPIMQTTIPPVASAEQLAATVTWLLSDDASSVNGAVLPSDGGWSAL